MKVEDCPFEKYRLREAEKQRDRETNRHTQLESERDKHIKRQRNRQKQTSKLIDRQKIERERDRQSCYFITTIFTTANLILIQKLQIIEKKIII